MVNNACNALMNGGPGRFSIAADFVKQNHAQLWIQHDYTSGIKRKIAPAFYN
jgi:hypothetical protein